MLSLFKHIKFKDYLLFAIVAVFIVLQVYTELAIPELFAKIINQIVVKTELGQTSSYTFLLPIALEMLAYIFATLIIFLVVGFLMAKFSSNVSKNFRSVFYAKVMSLSYGQAKGFSTSSLLTRTTNDTENMERFFSRGLRIFLTAPVMSVMAIMKIVRSNFSLALGTMLTVIVLIVTVTVIFVIAVPKFKKIQTLTDKINASVKENLTGIKDIRAFNKEKFHTERYEKNNAEITKTSTFIDRVMALLDPVMIFAINGLMLFIYWFGAYLASNQLINIGEIIAFGQYATMVLFSLTALTFVFIMLPRASVSAKRINEILKAKDEFEVLKSSVMSVDKKSKEKVPFIEYKDISFSYPNAKGAVLENISFKVQKGQTIAFIGATGSGKTTLINLLTRLYDVTSGEILLEGKNIEEFEKSQLLNKIAFIPQKALLFKGTVRSNLTLKHKDAQYDELVKALEIAQAKDFVLKDELGLDKQVAQGGRNFSGGQKQRLAIARAIVKQCPIMIFDDSFSALDFKTDKMLRNALSKNYPQATKLIVAQRVGTIMDADKIVVLENGKAVGIGTHKQLLKSCSVYRQIAISQLGEKEVEDAK